ncbi:Uncharacterised protein [Mycobacteroides abscessus subsp. abscessus]|nr:Uncharacterised protein [Mycobacteroides abscessus subsp. abscessus]
MFISLNHQFMVSKLVVRLKNIFNLAQTKKSAYKKPWLATAKVVLNQPFNVIKVLERWMTTNFGKLR